MMQILLRWIVRLMPRVALPVIRGPLRGTRFTLGAAAGRGGGASIHLGRSESMQARAMDEVLKLGDVVFDVGSNVGFYTVLAGRRVGSEGAVVAFEPAVRNLAYLERHVRINGLANVVILPLAAGARETLSFFSPGDNPATGHVVPGMGDSMPPSHGELTLVPVTTIDSVADLLGRDPAVIKIDVEGAELDVLRGAARCLTRASPIIFLSVHSEELRRQCLAHLRSVGYRATPLVGQVDEAGEFVCRSVENVEGSSRSPDIPSEDGE